VAGALAVAAAAGCLGEPEIEDRWTRLDVLSSNVSAGTARAVGDSVPVSLRTAITYRQILTGFLVVELRASGAMDAGDVEIDPEAPRLDMAHDIDALLASSVTAGRATRAVTGWDHLIQEVGLSFTGRVPASADSGGAAPVGLFLLAYLAEGEEIELEDGSDSLVVTPFPSDEYQILPVGFELEVTP
jgi:hypothetical protein